MVSNKILLMGGIIIDSYMVVDYYPERGQDTFILDSFERVGGCSINVANTLKNFGCMPYIVSAVGDDPRGNLILQYLTKAGFDTTCIKILHGEKSGYCLTILDSNGERTFLTYKGCEEKFDLSMISEDLINQVDLTYVTGYFLLNKKYHTAILNVLDKLKTASSKIMFDPGPLVGYINKDMLTSVLKRADVLVPNTVESERIKTKLGFKKDLPFWALENGITLILEKMGDKGVKVWTKDAYHIIPPYKVKSVDTTGAGDSFAGALIYGLIRNFSLEDAVHFASACGALATTLAGPHGDFGLDEVMQVMEKRKEHYKC
ncbi:MAG: carbohydrate kinase family protein [Firmicutes bacterium]|nr:carbohydrate kinase family protein [Bacillota bacterium]